MSDSDAERIERSTELYCPCEETYGMLKEAGVGGKSLVFTRYHEAGVARITSHQYSNGERLALWTRKGRPLQRTGQSCANLYRTPESRNVVWIHGGGC